ncbi:SDR family NAD(P)-dependent oxidoreductase [Hymenobacter lapidiphilus]|uniref:NAD(P)H-binding protein n=1 Tax=Hymenobacter sp. CCM 8763 TaxID=2303334 RepID=UPI000E3501C5|nr:NAD(P)H-binding protein [Hymenobacter sp. CCM 8763]RFP64974.1 SDR family NAD(P)-dependent oxidoreductase [Hymenobacter sp. CCM 8763]
MLVITGANGQLGAAIIENLLRTMPASQLVATTREPEKCADLAKRGVQIRAGDFGQPKTLLTAFAGADQVLLVSANKLGEEARQLHRTAIEAAGAAGAGRILYTSHMGARADSPFEPAQNHAASEAMLAGQRVAYTSLRHGFYAESALHMVEHGLREGVLRVPEDGPVSWTTRADLAEADALILAQPGRFGGLTPPLTALEAITMADMAALASEVSGREIRHVTVTDDEWKQAAVARGTPAPVAELLLGTFRAARRGDFAATDPTLQTLLGRAPQTMREVLAGFLKPMES